MKRLATVVVIAATLAAAPTAAQAGWRKTECRFQFLDGRRNWSSHEVRRTIDCATHKWSVSRSTAFYVANRESHFGQWARNPYSGACGVFQFYPASSMRTRLHRVLRKFKPWGTSCFNARSNVLAAVWEMHRYGFGAWGL